MRIRITPAISPPERSRSRRRARLAWISSSNSGAAMGTTDPSGPTQPAADAEVAAGTTDPFGATHPPGVGWTEPGAGAAAGPARPTNPAGASGTTIAMMM